MNAFWSGFVAIVSIANILGCWWLIRWASKRRPGEAPLGEPTGHTWDGGTLSEYNNPMPRWWLWKFYIFIVFGLIYLILYPGLGNFKGLLGWTQEGQYQSEIQAANDRYGPLFAKYAGQDIAALAKDPEALKIGQRLFTTYCSQCHGSDAKGAPGFPNLADKDWLHGGEPAKIEETILGGRNSMMPPMAAAVGDDKAVDDVVSYVMGLSGQVSKDSGVAGKEKFEQICGACHTASGQGNPALGAPNLTDNTWLYGGSRGAIKKTIMEGRHGVMPAHKDFLGADKVHVLAAYVYSLSQGQ
ncbi:MAG: cytochrome-c oxidase, cbb3-type subunit III [Gammaproteobacteria bacterium]